MKRRTCVSAALTAGAGWAMAGWPAIASAGGPSSAPVREPLVREALLIGNETYPDVPLRNPVNDAQALGRTLDTMGFRSTVVRNAGWRTMIDAVQGFLAKASDTEVRLLFYAGHGAQVRGRNYLIPVDAPMDNVEALLSRSLDVNDILERMARQRSGLKLLVLDACRNNPVNDYRFTPDGRRIKVRGAPRGLAPMQPPMGSLVAFATAPGAVAEDGEPNQPNSLYTRHLLRHIATPGLSLEQMFKRVRVGVLQDSAQRQRPWEESSLTVDYCLAGCGVAASSPANGR